MTTQHLFSYPRLFPSSISIWIVIDPTCKFGILSAFRFRFSVRRQNEEGFYCLWSGPIVSNRHSDSIIVSRDLFSIVIIHCDRFSEWSRTFYLSGVFNLALGTIFELLNNKLHGNRHLYSIISGKRQIFLFEMMNPTHLEYVDDCSGFRAGCSVH